MADLLRLYPKVSSASSIPRIWHVYWQGGEGKRNINFSLQHTYMYINFSGLMRFPISYYVSVSKYSAISNSRTNANVPRWSFAVRRIRSRSTWWVLTTQCTRAWRGILLFCVEPSRTWTLSPSPVCVPCVWRWWCCESKTSKRGNDCTKERSFRCRIDRRRWVERRTKLNGTCAC